MTCWSSTPLVHLPIDVSVVVTGMDVSGAILSEKHNFKKKTCKVRIVEPNIAPHTISRATRVFCKHK